jgi:hypothetical protein
VLSGQHNQISRVLTTINGSVVSTSTPADISVRVGVGPGLYLFAESVMLGMICSIPVTAAPPFG